MDYEAKQTPADDEQEQEERENEEENEEETEDSGERTKGKESRRGGGQGNGEPDDGDTSDEEEREVVLGHKGMALPKWQFYPREEVRQILLDEAKAQEQWEDQAWDTWMGAIGEKKDKIEEAMKELRYDPDKIREDASAALDAIINPPEPNISAIQELRAKKFPQPQEKEE